MSDPSSVPPSVPSPGPRGLAALVARPELLGLAIYLVCLTVILVLYHFQES